MNWQKYIHSDPTILTGKPLIRGTRLSIDFLLGRLAEGWPEKRILENYPQLTPEALQALFALRDAGHDIVSITEESPGIPDEMASIDKYKL